MSTMGSGKRSLALACLCGRRNELFSRDSIHGVEALRGNLEDKTRGGQFVVVNGTSQASHPRALHSLSYRVETDSCAFSHAARPTSNLNDDRPAVIFVCPRYDLFDPLAGDSGLALL